MPTELTLKIGEIVVELRSDQPEAAWIPSKSYRPFISTDFPQVLLQVHYGSLPDLPPGEKVFDSGGVWELSRAGDRWIIRLQSPVIEPSLYQLGIFEHDFRRGDIYLHAGPAQTPFPFEHPLNEVLMVILLAQEQGVLLHACGLSDAGAGLLFCGSSGAGKSTTARLWQGTPGVRLLSDDRMIVRKKDGKFWIYGTPWHGDAGAVLADSAPLQALYILKQGPRNEVTALKPLDAVTRLVVRAFPTFWNSAGMEFTLQFLADLAQSVDCYEFSFTPDATAVEYIRCLNAT